MLSDGTYDYEYDAEGNRTKKTDGTTGGYVEYTWDHRNRLTAVTFRDQYDAKTKEVLYTYDPLDRLIRKQVDDDGTVDRAEAFVYDGGNVVFVFDDAGSLTHRYLHGDAVDQVFLEETVGEILWGLPDNQGTIRDVANYDPPNDASSVLNHRQFDAFGNITAESDPDAEFRYAWTGRYFDEDTGLQYNRARWYDAAVGRWISEDPLGFGAGDANINRYVGNGPTNGIDPSGLFGEPGIPLDYNGRPRPFLTKGDYMRAGLREGWLSNNHGPTHTNSWESEAYRSVDGFFGGWADALTLGWSTTYREKEYGVFANNSGPSFETGQTVGKVHGVTTLVVGGTMIGYYAIPAAVGAYDTASIYIYSHGTAWWTATFGGAITAEEAGVLEAEALAAEAEAAEAEAAEAEAALQQLRLQEAEYQSEVDLLEEKLESIQMSSGTSGVPYSWVKTQEKLMYAAQKLAEIQGEIAKLGG